MKGVPPKLPGMALSAGDQVFQNSRTWVNILFKTPQRKNITHYRCVGKFHSKAIIVYT